MFFFFFKQKTAYEMRISDWSSDVCSSDLDGAPSLALYRINLAIVEAAVAVADTRRDSALDLPTETLDEMRAGIDLDGDGKIATATHIHALPRHYVGAAASVAVTRFAYPLGPPLLPGAIRRAACRGRGVQDV